MDDSPIQTALCVIGHPIGGNPTQFVAQRALAALGLDWQFMSFDVAPSQIEKAISGVDSLGFCGSMISSPYQTQVAEILSMNRGEASKSANDDVHATAFDRRVRWHDCLFRDDNSILLASNVYAEALKRIIESHAATIDCLKRRCLLLGDETTLASRCEPFSLILPESCLAVVGEKLVSWPLSAISPIQPLADESTTETETTTAPSSNEIGESPVLVIWTVDAKPSKKPVPKSLPQSPSPSFVTDLLLRLHEKSLIIDLSGTANAWLAPRKEHNEKQLTVVSNTELEVHRLAIAIHRWTGYEPNIDTMREAIEEYLEI